MNTSLKGTGRSTYRTYLVQLTYYQRVVVEASSQIINNWCIKAGFFSIASDTVLKPIGEIEMLTKIKHKDNAFCLQGNGIFAVRKEDDRFPLLNEKLLSFVSNFCLCCYSTFSNLLAIKQILHKFYLKSLKSVGVLISAWIFFVCGI